MQGRFVEVKSISEDGTFSGLLSTYGNLDQVGDICEKGCFDRTVRERGVKRPLLWQHSQADPIGSLVITGTEDALSVDGRFNLDVAKGREGYALLKAKDIDGLSIGYYVRDYEYDRDGVRHLKDVDLLEGSLVTVPANELARAQAKSGRLEAMSRYAKMRSLKGLTEAQRKSILAELDGLKVGDVDEDGNEVVEIIDDDEEKAEDEEESGEGSEEESEEKAEDEDQDEVEEALKTLSEAIKRLRAKMGA